MDTKIDQLKQIIPEKYIFKTGTDEKSYNIPIWGNPADSFCGTREYGRDQSGQRFAKEEKKYTRKNNGAKEPINGLKAYTPSSFAWQFTASALWGEPFGKDKNSIQFSEKSSNYVESRWLSVSFLLFAKVSVN